MITLLLMANHRENEWEWQGRRFKVKKGSFVTSLESIRKSAGKGISIQNVRAAIARYEKLGFLTNKSTKSGRLITVRNWSKYQQTEKATQQRNQQRGNKEATPNNNDNNVKIYTHYLKCVSPMRKSRQRALANLSRHLKKYTEKDLIAAADNYASTLNGNDPQYRKDPANFFGITEKYFTDFLPGDFEPPENNWTEPPYHAPYTEEDFDHGG